MLELSFLKTNKERTIQGLKIRNFSDEALQVVDRILETDETRRNAQVELDNNLAESKRLAGEIGGLLKLGKSAEAEAIKSKVATLKEQSKDLESTMKVASEELEELLLTVPNIPHHSVPAGKAAEDNEVYQAWDKPLPSLHPGAMPHWELAKKYNVFDLDLGVKLTGAGFPVFRGKGARLERSLINFFLDEAARAGYEEIAPPLLVNSASAKATGQLPDKEGQMYYVERDDLYLIPTAEVPVTNIYRDVIVDEKDFPIKMTGYTQCFRREAGSYGAHVRGLNRVHQFDKVEIVQIAHPDSSYAQLEGMLAHVSSLLDKLELPYRILRLCGGDMSFTSALTFDFEVWSAAQERWLEVSSVSNFETYQSNRLKVRFKDGNKTRLAHTLNGSALALARIVAALLENNQTPEGIRLPKVLHSYTGWEIID
ncbi:MAG: serine--tRNA ligase [Saprospiraceae bacterium]|nr:serine--tRNA ligase [Saprospiraceae bacterium]MCF8249068.1 serine--tRNA ligase [Saprospiraceae bacterium]MCF8280935.1 serine--tRNA ligase [Bacteroidales bacterium]MCF8311090.1 serine--tRNA ligase [Saprospiraceae bacterium]MCF8440180.1 serine--tRNA ligase [Saprospiraceae bacterium]